jgi:hypothetical protein
MKHEFINPYPELVQAYADWKINGTPVSQDVVANSIMYAYVTNEPIPRELLGILCYAFEALRRGHDDPLFARAAVDTVEGRRIPRGTHPEAAFLEYHAVSYVRTCKQTGLDLSPVRTICDAYGVSRTTVHNWMRKYTRVPDNRSKEDLDMILDKLAPLYSDKRNL